ncbi:MAG: S26 family signal peptidase [Gemmataceae bacterium]
MPDREHVSNRQTELPARLLRTSLLFLIGFMFVRTALLEPFGVPTGSMAITLLGNHRECACPRCGYPVVVGEMPANERRSPYANATCDNCGKRGISLTQSPDIQGDRLLVDKNVYSIRPPLRWELGVFHCPVDSSTPYVKRVVGLPGEQIQILGGDLFINGEIARKTVVEYRQMLVPIFDSTFEPDTGWAVRWQVESARPPRPANQQEWNHGVLTLDSMNGEAKSIAYRNINVETLKEEPIRDVLGYNAGVGVGRTETVHDFCVSFDLIILDTAGKFSCSLTDGLGSATFQIGMGPKNENSLTVTTETGQSAPHHGDYDVQRVRHYDFAMIDRRVTLREDGVEILPAQDLPADPTRHGRRSAVSSPFRFSLAGGKVEIANVRLFRDVHYRADGANGIDTPLQLGTEDFFCLGDNSANSRDGRVWKIPAVPRSNFLGKPFLIHQPMHLARLTLNGNDRTFPALDWQRMRWVR